MCLLKILILTEYFPDTLKPVFTGGVESRVFHLVKFLEKSHKVEVVKRTGIYSFNSLAAVIHRVLFFLRQLVKIIFVSEKYDVVEGTNFSTHILAFLYARKTGAKAVAWYPDVFIGRGVERLGLISGLATELAERLTIRLPWDGVIALSGETKKKLIKAGINTRKIKTIYGGVNYNFYNNYKDYPKFKHPTLICIARLVKYKRVQDLLLAIYFLQERFRDIRAIIVGIGPEKKNLIKLSRQLGIYERISWMKSVSENQKRELLSRSHLHVLPSVVEGFGLVTIEALAAGTPVVNADIPINKEILNKQQATRDKLQVLGGLLFRVGDAADLAEKIEILLLDKKLYNQKVSEGEELVKKYEWQKVNRQTEEFYQHLLSD